MFRNTSDDDRGHRRDRDFDASRGGDRRDERPHAGGFNTRTYSSADARKQEYGRMGPSDRRSESFGRAADRRPGRPSSLNYSRGDSRPMDNRRRDLETSASSRLSLSGLMPLPKTTPVDHKEKCPFTVRFFIKHEDPHDPKEFESADKLPSDEIPILVWTDVTMRYISDLLRAQRADIRTSILTFNIIYRDFRTKELRPRTVAKISPIRPGPSDSKTFEEMRYHQGDYISVLATKPERKQFNNGPREDNGNFGRDNNHHHNNNNNNRHNSNHHHHQQRDRRDHL